MLSKLNADSFSGRMMGKLSSSDVDESNEDNGLYWNEEILFNGFGK